MEDFMLLFKGIHYNDLGLTPEELQSRLQKWSDWSERLGKQGILKGGDALTSEVRNMSGTDQVITDYATAELKEVIGGYFIISVANLEEATKIARDYPDFDTLNGAVEIRKIHKYDYDN